MITDPLERAAELLRIALTETCERVELALLREDDVLELHIVVALRRDRVARTTVQTIDIGHASTEVTRQAAVHAVLVDLRRAIAMVVELK